MPSPDTDPNRTKFSDSDHHHIGLRTSGTVGGERNSTSCEKTVRPVFIPHCHGSPRGRQGPSETSFPFQIVLMSNRMHPTRSTGLARSLRKFLRTAVSVIDVTPTTNRTVQALSSYGPTSQTCKQKALGGRQCSILSAIQV